MNLHQRAHGAALGFLLFFSLNASAQDLAVSTHADPAPAEVAAPVKALLASGGARVTAADATLDFWWVQSLPVKGDAAVPAEAPPWARVEEGALVGAVRLSAAHKDIRGKGIKPGVYTLRLGIQPANGDHLGVSPFREFLLLSPVDVDQDPKATGHEGTVEMSTKAAGSSHPAVWSLDPPAAASTLEPLKVYTNETGHKAVIFQVPMVRDGKPAGLLRFGVVLVGLIEA